MTNIKIQAEIARNRRIKEAEDRAREETAQSLTQSIMGHQTWAKMVQSLGDEVASGMMKNALMSMLTADMTKEKDAAAAARKAFLWGWDHGGPAAPVIAPIMGAAAFAATMAFQSGTDRVPGVGRGDVVPSMLEPGEGVVPGGVMDGLSKMAREGSLGGSGTHYNVHIKPTYHVQALDGGGVQAVLDKHTDRLQRHFENTLRKLNR